MKKAIFILAIISSLFAFNSCQKFNEFLDLHQPNDEIKADATVAMDWYRLELRFLLERNTTLTAAYWGYLGVGLYEAVRNESKNSKSLNGILYTMPQMPVAENNSYDWILSANAAMASMLRSFNIGLTPANLSSIDSLESLYNQQSKTVAGTDKFLRSQDFGRRTATAIYNWYLTDNFNSSNTGYVMPVFPGAWELTPPGFIKAINPFVSSARTFLPSNASLVAPALSFPYSEIPGSDFYNMVKKVYDFSLSLTTEQKNIADYWWDRGNGTGYTPSGHEMSIITQAIAKKKVGLAIAAEAYAKAGIAERDAIIVCYKSEYTYNLLRPVTYIRKLIDPNWMSYILTPAHPGYPSAHTLLTGSVMEAVSSVLGDHINLTDHTYDFRGFAPRTYSTFFSAAEDAGISRFYGGINYEPSIKTSLDLAKIVGGSVRDIKLHD